MEPKPINLGILLMNSNCFAIFFTSIPVVSECSDIYYMHNVNVYFGANIGDDDIGRDDDNDDDCDGYDDDDDCDGDFNKMVTTTTTTIYLPPDSHIHFFSF